MAGSYNHCVTEIGNLRSNERIAASLENSGDVYEAVEEMYGMIWYLAGELVANRENVESVKEAVEDARKGYKEGLKFSKEINRMPLDQRRN